MLRLRTRVPKFVLIALIVLIIAGSTYAFAAQNTIALSAAGYKAQVISGYAVSDIIYDLTTGDPTKLSKIIFTISPITAGDPAPVTVLISTTAVQGFTSSECVVVGAGPYTATCTFGTVAVPAPINVIDVTKLDIVITSSTNP